MMKRKSRLQTFINGSENYSCKKSVLIRVRWFESIPVHQVKILEVLKLLGFFAIKEVLKMLDITNKQRGNCGLGIAIGYFSTNGYTVSIPLNDTQDYDLLIDKDNNIKSVQVKYTTCKTKYGNYQVALKSCGGTKGRTYKTVRDTNVDYLFIATDRINSKNF